MASDPSGAAPCPSPKLRPAFDKSHGVPESTTGGDPQGQAHKNRVSLCDLNQSGDYLYRLMAMASTHSIGLEVVPIDSEHSSRTEPLCRSDQRCIRQIHRMIRVQLHELERSRQCMSVKEPHQQPAGFDEVSQTV